MKMLWSMVSKAAERSRRQRHDTFCDPISLMRWSWMYSRAVSVEWCLQYRQTVYKCTHKYSEISCTDESNGAIESRPADDKHRALRLGQRLSWVALQQRQHAPVDCCTSMPCRSYYGMSLYRKINKQSTNGHNLCSKCPTVALKQGRRKEHHRQTVLSIMGQPMGVLCVFLFVRLRISPLRLKLAVSNFARRFTGISNFGELCSPRRQKSVGESAIAHTEL